jgi:hypothetical protein
LTEEPTSADGFSIYLIAQKISADQLASVRLGDLELASQPILSGSDIIRYSKETHEIELMASAAERIQRLYVPTSGRPFVVCVGREPIYSGAFWALYSSQSFDGIVIETTLVTQDHPSLRIQLGYPASEFFTGKDYRSDPRILRALERAGRLK